MEVEGSPEDLVKKIVDLEAQCEWWKNEQMKWKEQLMKVKGEEERTKEKHMKWKGKCAEMRAKYHSEKMRWWEEDHKNRESYWQAELEKRKAVVDLKAAWSQLRRRDEDAVQLKATEAEVERLKSSLEERDRKIGNLLEKIAAMDGQNHSLQTLKEEGEKIIVEREAVIKVLDQENMALEAQIEQLKKEKTSLILKSEQDVEFTYQASAVSNIVGVSGSPASENQDKKSSDESHNKRKKESLYRAGSSIVPQRRKVEALGCSIEKRIGTKQCKSGDHSAVGQLKWENDKRMFNAFTANEDLCMRSVCALYRKHNSLGPWKNYSSSSNKGFKILETKGMALGKFLTDRDPEGRMKKSLAELKREDPDGIDSCRLIARHHCTELFKIYKDNLDPLFIP